MAWCEVYELPVNYPYRFNLHGLSDLQIGSESSSSNIIRQRIDEITSDPIDSGVVILGDIEDEDRPSTRAIRRSAFADRDEVVHRDAEKHMAYIDKAIIPVLLPIQTKTKYGIMGVVAGHHWTQLSPVLNSVQYICNELTRISKKKVNYLGEMSSFLDIRFRGKNDGKIGVRSVGHIQHGEGGGQTKGSSLSKIERTAQGQIADWYMRAHDCQIVACYQPRLKPMEVRVGSAPKLLCQNIPYLNLGSATQGYDFNKNSPSYIESKMMRPTTMGWGTLKFNIRKARQHEDVNRNYMADIKIEI